VLETEFASKLGTVQLYVGEQHSSSWLLMSLQLFCSRQNLLRRNISTVENQDSDAVQVCASFSQIVRNHLKLKRFIRSSWEFLYDNVGAS